MRKAESPISWCVVRISVLMCIILIGAQSSPVLAFQVSAKTGFNIDDAFLSVVKAAMKRVKDEMPVIPDTLKIDAAATKPEASGCAC